MSIGCCFHFSLFIRSPPTGGQSVDIARSTHWRAVRFPLPTRGPPLRFGSQFSAPATRSSRDSRQNLRRTSIRESSVFCQSALNRPCWRFQLGVGFDGHFSIGLNLQSIIRFPFTSACRACPPNDPTPARRASAHVEHLDHQHGLFAVYRLCRYSPGL